MKTISVQQPWASLICAGIKDVENRTWKPKENPGRILIHASKKASKTILDKIPVEWASSILNNQTFGNIPYFEDMPSNAIIGYVDLVDIKEETDSLWDAGEGQLKWVLDNAYLFDDPICDVKGKLHLFDYEMDENNLPPAHKVELKYPKAEGSELVVPVDKEGWEVISGWSDKDNDEKVFEFDVNEDCEPVLIDEEGKKKTFKTVRFEREGEALRFELEPEPATGLFYLQDEDGNNQKFYSMFNPEPIEWVFCQLKVGKKIADNSNVPEKKTTFKKKNKVIKTSALESKFEGLHYLSSNAEELTKAMLFQAQKLDDMELTDEQSLAITMLADSIENWEDDFAKLASEMQGVESKYFDNMKDGNEKVEMIDEIPACSSEVAAELPDGDELLELLYGIGYYVMDNGTDPYNVQNREINKDVILNDIKTLYNMTNDFLYALGTVEFTGIWERVGELARKVIDNQPKDTIEMFFGLYGVDVK